MTFSPLIRRAFLLVLFLIASLTAWADDILFVGNSYTEGSASEAQKHDGVPKLVEAIAKAKGKQIATDGVIRGGKGWSYHMAQPVTDTKLNAKPWTWVVLQDQSEAVTKGGLDAFLKDGSAFYEKIIKAAPSAKIVLYETWARPVVYFKGDAASSEKMIKVVHEGYSKLQATLSTKSARNEVRLAPAGSAFWELEGKSAMNLHAPDNHHANVEGYYLAALVIYRTIYHDSVIGAPTRFFNDTVVIPDEDAKKLQATAEAAVK